MPRGSSGGGGSRGGGGGRGGGGHGGGRGGSWGGGHHGGGGRHSGSSWGGGGGKVWSRPAPGIHHGGWPRPRPYNNNWWNARFNPSDTFSYALPSYPIYGFPWYVNQFNPLPNDLDYGAACYLSNGSCVNNVTPLRCSANGGIPDPLQPCSFTGRPAFGGTIFPWRAW